MPPKSFRTALPPFVGPALGLLYGVLGAGPFGAQEETQPSTLSGAGPSGSWDGLRTRLAARGVSFEGALILHTSRAFEGGLEERDTTRHLLDLALTFDLATLAGLDGATFGLDFYDSGGHSGGDDVGALQGISNIDSDDRSQVAEAWYEQLLFGESLRLKIGKVDVNSEFAFADSAGEFTNPSAGISPAILGAPTYPDPATSVNLFYTHTSGWSVNLGVYDGATNAGESTGSHGPSTFLGAPSDLFLIGELGTRWTLGSGQAVGRVGVGLWRHTGTFDEFSGGQTDGTEGIYLVLDQELWRENPGQADDTQGWAGYLMAARAEAEVSEIETHLGLGLVRSGLFDCCEADACGLCLNRVGLSEEASFSAEAELNVELFFKHQLCGWCSVKPDLQFVSNPGGDASADDAWVAAIRLEFGI